MSAKGNFSIEKAVEKHGDWYDYSQVNYVNSNTKVKILCPKHGEFWQTPNEHINRGSGCILCSYEKNANLRSSCSERFIKQTNAKQGNIYDYSKVDYSTSRIKVIVVCDKHGEFEQVPYRHLNGSGCPKCADELSAMKRALTAEEFKENAKSIHGDKYEYILDGYVNGDSSIRIKCQKHGEFTQKAKYHLASNGCYKCSVENAYIDRKSTRLNSSH